MSDDHTKARRRYIGPGGFNGCPCCAPERPDRKQRKLETKAARCKLKRSEQAKAQGATHDSESPL